MKHFIITPGLEGYFPECCKFYDTRKEAIEALIRLHQIQDEELEGILREALLLEKNGFFYCTPDSHYPDSEKRAEVKECSCSNPDIHRIERWL